MTDRDSRLFGMNIVSHPLAITLHWEVQRHPIRKKRRNYCVVCVQRPGCYQAGNTLCLHPELVAKLRAMNGTAGAKQQDQQ